MNDKILTDIVDIFYDLKVLVVLTKHRNTGDIELSAYEMISDKRREMVKVLDWQGQALGNRSVNFAVRVTKNNYDTNYEIVVSIGEKDEVTKASSIILERFQFKYSSKELDPITQPDAFKVHNNRCADQVKTSGDVVAVICDADSSIRFYRYSDLSEITSHITLFNGQENQLYE